MALTSEIPSVLLGSLAWLVILPLSAPFIIFFLTWRAIAFIYIKIRHPFEPVESLGYYDIFASVQEVGLFISYALHVDGRISLDQVRSHFHETFVKDGLWKKYPVFYYNCVTILGHGYKRRVVKSLDLKYHIWERVLAAGETLDNVAREVMWDNDRLRGPTTPKWEIVLLHDPVEGSSCLLFKISHALADGYSYFYLLNKLTGMKVDVPKNGGQFKPSLFQTAPIVFLHSTREMKVARESVLPFGTDLKSRSFLNKDPDQESRPKLMSSKVVDFRKIKEISKLSGTRVLHVLMALHYWALKLRAEEVFELELNPKTVQDPLFVTFILPKPNHPTITEGRCTNHMMWGILNLPMNSTDRISFLRRIASLSDAHLLTHTPIIVDLFYKAATYLVPKQFLIEQECAQQAEYIHLVTPFIYPGNYNIFGTPVSRVQLVFGGDDMKYASGTCFGPVTKGDEVELCLGTSIELFANQAELDYHVHKTLPYELDSFLQECRKLK